MIRRFASLAVGLILLNLTPAIFTGCAGKSVSEEDPASLYADAEEDIQSDHYQLAIDKLRIIKNKFPYSKYAIDAQLRIADVLFMQEAYGEAAAAYETFRDLHPKHEKVGYAMFRVGKSYYDEIPSPVSRDLTPASKALDAYTEYLRRFPTDANAPEARKDMEHAKTLLAEKELYIGDFYFKRDYLISAKPRYQKILDFFPETEPAKAAKEKLVEIDLRLTERPDSAKGREPVKK